MSMSKKPTRHEIKAHDVLFGKFAGNLITPDRFHSSQDHCMISEAHEGVFSPVSGPSALSPCLHVPQMRSLGTLVDVMP